jgi:hyperosmotically inducible periplasmic protein
MFRLLKLILLLLVVLVGGAFVAGWWGRAPQAERDAVATAGRAGADRAREVASQVGQKTAEAAKTAQEALSDGSLTAKIKAKMALDDTVKALDLNIDTVDGVVTVTGKVRTSAERDRALALARETNGVKRVVDRTSVSSR